ncbi:endopygalactorunase [Ereboglobus luteus]|uniref:Endopygalactorunase n=1 Tax=Ereboglobus luteus TaxID=1796921 RepID=A0A2U8E5X1_9BACT|nr:endopygalactorunase [Ereboglobus luteus]AWI10257.1 endopygalactorunase [Ereboglobus luteus]
MRPLPALALCIFLMAGPGRAHAAATPNIASVTGDTITLITGTTYSFTVDSQRDEGLVSTAATVAQLAKQLAPSGKITITRAGKKLDDADTPAAGDTLVIAGKPKRTLAIKTTEAALAGSLTLHRESITAGAAPSEITLDFTAGQRTPNATVAFEIPAGINVTMDNTFVNVIGRGEVPLSGLATQSIGRTGTNYSYKQVGRVSIKGDPSTGQAVLFTGIDLRPLNTPDIRLRITGVQLAKTGDYIFKAVYKTTAPKSLSSPMDAPSSVAKLTATNSISDFAREPLRQFTYTENADTHTSATFTWAPVRSSGSEAAIQISTDNARTWKTLRSVNLADGSVSVKGIEPGKLCAFRLAVSGGSAAGNSNVEWYYSGKRDIKSFGVNGNGETDETNAINAAIAETHRLGGGTLRFTKGDYNVRTLHLLSNVWLYLDAGATIQCIGDCDEPEPTWFSDRDYRSGLNPTDPKPYREPENWLTKQDVGHTFFRNAMFFAERQDNIKIVGTGRITGNGKIATSDRVMNSPAGKRADKMFTLKLCTNIEIGGHSNGKDLWYDREKDVPYYIEYDDAGARHHNFDVSNMLHIDRGGHFVVLATGSDDLHMHDTYFAKHHSGNARDIYDFMACGNVTVTNIYSKVSSDDIVKPGSDCSLGFTRPVRNYKVRNIVGDTNCNLFQIGSETADDIQDLCVDNIYVLAANKAGFSISTNDGAHIKNVHLNCGHTGTLHSRSKMLRTRAPFFISISNRGRVLGADVERYKFDENGSVRDELLVTNSDIGRVENIIINAIDCEEVYGGSSYGNKPRWRAYDGKLNRATPIIAGFKIPDNKDVHGGLKFKLPNGLHTGYITNVQFTDVTVLVKGGNPESDRDANPPEIGVGRYNVGDLKTQPAYGFWARHVKDFLLKDCAVNYETPDARHAVVLDDVIGARIENLKAPTPENGALLVKKIKSQDVIIK